jgi:uncharacterized damage-inducible protein DinB
MDKINPDPRYPIGKFSATEIINGEQVQNYINVLKTFPKKLREEVSVLNDEMLDQPYRENGWTIRQVVHHLADSHMNSYCRFKLAYTEDNPVIKSYLEAAWAETEDAKKAPVYISLNLIDSIHARWVIFVESLEETDLEKSFYHPQNKRNIRLKEALALYAWHCNHHLAHIINLKKEKKW